MKFFIDTAEIDEIKSLIDTGLVDGITTNPTLIAKSGRQINEVIAEICALVPGPVSAEVAAIDYKGMMNEGLALAKIADNVVVKVPLTPEGLRACKDLRSQDIMVNVTLCFSAAQALLAAKCDATFISPFIGRLDDIGQNGMELIQEICHIYSMYDYETQVLAASIRGPLHVIEAAKAGADVATIPTKVLHQLYKHSLTDSGLSTFVADWKQTGQSII